MNAVEHGAAPGQQTRISVTLNAGDPPATGRRPAVLQIMDEGPGLPDGFNLAASESLGLTVAQQFAVALNGELKLLNRPDRGTLARLHLLSTLRRFQDMQVS